MPCRFSSASVSATCSGDGLRSSTPKMPSSGGRQVRRHVERRHRLALGELILRGDHAPTPAIDRGVEHRQAACGEVDLAAARAEPDDTHLAARVRLRSQEGRGAVDVTDQAVVRHAAGGAHHRRHVVGRARALAVVEVGADRCVAVVCQLARDLLRAFVPAGHVMYDHDPRVRSGTQRPRVVRVDVVARVSAKADGLRDHPLIHSPLLSLSPCPATQGSTTRPGACRSGGCAPHPALRASPSTWMKVKNASA